MDPHTDDNAPRGSVTRQATTAEEVLQFWLGELDADGMSTPAHSARWWKKDPDFDAEISGRFGKLHGAAVRGELTSWLKTPRGLLAAVILVDQFSRNMFRGDPKTWAWDHVALRLASDAIDRGWDRQLASHERVFLYMPLMHAEDLPAQERCIALFEGLADEVGGAAGDRLRGNIKFAIAHRDIVARFGRFPHRNAILGRACTPEELDFLQQPGSSF